MKINNPLENKSLKQIYELRDNINSSDWRDYSYNDMNKLIYKHNQIYKRELRLLYNPENFHMIIR